ncbi:MAG: HD domain-containing protein [Patescibacteria group bacterium]
MDTQDFRDKLFSQEPRLIEVAHRLATSIRATPQDAKYADVTPRAFIVGGFVRDTILGGHPKDIDIEVYGVSPERLEEILHQLYPGVVNTVGRSFGILKIHLGEDVEFDVSIPRRESKTGRGHKGFAVTSDPGMTLEDAARRRDFTWNALAADPLTGELIDPFGGLQDLRDRILRVTDAERFQDDPLRVYRALQLAARMEMTVEPKSHELLREMVARGDLTELAPERVTEELRKLLLKAQKPSIGFALARELGIIERDYSELQALIGCEQEAEWHPEGDVWTHTLMVIDEAAKIIRDPARTFSAEEKLEVMIGALCHDVGKPATTAHLEGRIRSRGHEEAGVEPTQTLLGRLSFGDHILHAAVAIVKDHLKPGMLSIQRENGALTDTTYANAIRKLLKRIHPTSWCVLVAASEADYRGRGIPGSSTEPYAHGNLLAETVQRYRLDEAPTQPLIQGRDLLALGMTPGPSMGKLIAHIEKLRDAGTLTTREEALLEATRRLHDFVRNV